MIHAVRANVSTFRSIKFSSGMNIILAERTSESGEKDSRNGLGKTSLISIINFCLGSSSRPRKGLRVPALEAWQFTLDISLGSRRLQVHRSVEKPNMVIVEGDIEGLDNRVRRGGALDLRLKDWKAILGREMFSLPEQLDNEQYSPTFRSLFGYFARQGRNAYTNPFEHNSKQREWDKQVNNTFLLGLSWKNAREWQRLKDKGKILDTLKKAVSSGLVEGMVGSLGELETERIRLSVIRSRQEEELRTFRVHPEYRHIEEEASRLTAEIHELSNQNIADERLLTCYRESLLKVKDIDPEVIRDLYEQAGVELPGLVIRRLEEVQEFNIKLLHNRKEFLASEIKSLEFAIESRNALISEYTEERATQLSVLKEHGALKEYTVLQQRFLSTTALVNDVDTRIANLRKFRKGRSSLQVELAQLFQKANLAYDENYSIRERAVNLFNSHSEALYQVPGRLVIEIRETGFKFTVDIERSGSQGIDCMKVFCYDLMLAQLWSNRPCRPGFLIHDSTIYDGVDERQVANALQRACDVSSENGFQYICTMNSDSIPEEDFQEGFEFEKYIRHTLSDSTPEGSLFGFRF